MSRADTQSQESDALVSTPTDLGVRIASPDGHARLRSPLGAIVFGVGGRSALMLTNMLVLLVTSRVMAPSDFGRFAIAQVAVDLAAAASYGFVGIPMLQSRRLRAVDYRNAFTILLIIGIAAGAFLYSLAGPLEQLLEMPGLKPLLEVAGFLLPIRCATSFFMAALQRQSKVNRIVWAQTKSQIIAALGVTLILAALGFGAWALLLGLSAATVLEMAWCARAARIRPQIGLTRASWQLARKGVAPLASRMLVFGSDSIDRLAVGAGFGAAPLGIYTRASSLVLIPTNLIGLPTQNALMSWFSRLTGNKARIAEALKTAVAFQGVLLFPVIVALWLASPLLVRLLLGEQWLAAIPIAQILFIGVIARLATAPLECAALTAGYAWGAARRQAIAFTILVVALPVAIGESVFWVAVAVSMSRVVYYMLTLRFVVVTFHEAWRPIIAAHGKSLVLASAGFLLAFAAVKVVQLPWTTANELVIIASYVVGCGLVLLFGPRWLVAPAGSLTLGIVTGLGKRLFARSA